MDGPAVSQAQTLQTQITQKQSLRVKTMRQNSKIKLYLATSIQARITTHRYRDSICKSTRRISIMERVISAAATENRSANIR
jgi:hypothetical protein